MGKFELITINMNQQDVSANFVGDGDAFYTVELDNTVCRHEGGG